MPRRKYPLATKRQRSAKGGKNWTRRQAPANSPRHVIKCYVATDGRRGTKFVFTFCTEELKGVHFRRCYGNVVLMDRCLRNVVGLVQVIEVIYCRRLKLIHLKAVLFEEIYIMQFSYSDD